MLIQFDTADLRSMCEDAELATQQFGSDARLLLSGLADLISAPSLSELPPGITEPVAETSIQYRIAAGAFRLIFSPNHKVSPIDKAGNLDARKVTRVKVIMIERHE